MKLVKSTFHAQVICTYDEPDIMELNYHAGTACRSLAHAVLTVYTGVKCCKPNDADAVTAVLLIATCLDENLDLARAYVNLQDTSQYLHSFLSLKAPDVGTLHLSM